MNPLETAAEPQLEFTTSGTKAGFRLHKLEVYNWGTFHDRVWSLELKGENALLTGDIGSGKSTLVDAVTTLLVPSQKIVYNKAAGAEKSERNLKTYVLGHFKSTRGEAGLSAKPIALRDQNSYSVILGRFFNESYGQSVTLAQVFWMKGEGQPARLFIVAEGALSIAEDFGNFGSDINDLKKRLRKAAHVEVYDSFAQYGANFRRRFGIENDQALELFNQTVSMKSVGNLTDFVREHMLEAFPMEARIQKLIAHFDDLRRAHEAVVTAKIQIERLIPLIGDCHRHAEISAGIIGLREGRDALRAWFADIKSGLLVKRLEKLSLESSRLDSRIETLTHVRKEQQTKRDDIKRAIADNGGDRLERLREEISGKKAMRDQRRGKAEKYNALASSVGLPEAGNADVFIVNQSGAELLRQDAESRQTEAQNELTEIGFGLRRFKEQHDEIQSELNSLRNRRSNIRGRELALRTEICRAVGINESAIPFAGELIQVREGEADWEGAIERVMHGFGLSLLVPESLYGRIAQWVDKTHLNNRLVYFRVREHKTYGEAPVSTGSLVHKLALKSDSPFYEWLDHEVAKRFDYFCCDHFEQFQRETKAITRSGQTKQGGERHEKDDRNRIGDRSQYVLGWTNEAKVAALEKQAGELQNRMRGLAEKHSRLTGELKGLKEKLEKFQQLMVFDTFQDLDWKPVVIAIEQLEREKKELEAASDVLRTLEKQLAELEAASERTHEELNEANSSLGEIRTKQVTASESSQECESLLSATPEEIKIRVFTILEGLRPEAIGDATVTIESCDNKEKNMREWLQARIDAEEKKAGRLTQSIVAVMQAFRQDYPLEMQEVDAHLDSSHEYEAILNRLNTDDLPRFLEKFKQLLNENTIREIAGFQSELNRERQSIKERIDHINDSLKEIDYNAGTFILLEAVPTLDAQVRDFQQDLRGCTEGALTGSADEAYSEAKFLQVKQIIERFRGREGSAEMDRRWMEKTTDVRNWFEFSASERWRETGEEHEHYSDSGGKSGGQKEKLAYTILAASLAYQFGIDSGEGSSRTFRFVVIDEAFGRGSDESAKFGLELFKRLKLQLLIVTPLQKIHIIEPHVASVGFVHNEEGRASFLRNLTIEEYRKERDAKKV